MRICLTKVLDSELNYTDGKNNAAVLVPIFMSEQPEILMIKRSDSLSRNAGELAFPGGLQEGEETPVETALRELKEEINIDEESVKILGYLNPEKVERYKIDVIPVVGLVKAEKKFVPNFEVKEILIDALLKVFLTRRLKDNEIKFKCLEHDVTGTSSRILDDLYHRLLRREAGRKFIS